jgi:hypothetical protein
MHAATPSKACTCPICNLPGRAVASLPQPRLEALVASSTVDTESRVQRSGGPNFLFMGMGAVFVLMSSRVITGFFGEEIATSGAPFEAPLATLVSSISSVAAIIAVLVVILSGFAYIFFGGPENMQEAKPAIDTPWAGRFMEIRICRFCHRVFDQSGRSEPANRDGFQRMMEKVDQRGDSRTWILAGGFSGQRRRARNGPSTHFASGPLAPQKDDSSRSTNGAADPMFDPSYLGALAMGSITLLNSAEDLDPSTNGYLPTDFVASARSEDDGVANTPDLDACACQETPAYGAVDQSACIDSPAQLD